MKQFPQMASFAFVLTLVVSMGGCSSGNDGGQTVTERMRKQVNPKVAEFMVEGQRAYERGSYMVALALTDSAEKYAPELADVHFLRGLIYTQMNRLDVAKAAYETVLKLDPEYQGARYNMGLGAFRRGKLRDAIDLYTEERELGETSDLMLELGRAYAKLGEPDSAQMAYMRAIELDSTNTTAYMWLGQLYEELGEMEQALTYSQKGLALQPDDPDYQYIVGSQLVRGGKAEEAVEYLKPVAEQRPWHHGAQYNLGQALMHLGQEERAQYYFTRADSAQQLQQKINEAQADINREPNVLEHWTRLGGLLRKSGQMDRAIEAYKVAVSLKPQNLFLQSNLAMLMMEGGDTEGAIRKFQTILHVDSTLADVWFNLGVAYANSGSNEAARKAWNKALDIRPGHPEAQAYLVQLSDEKGAQ